ncbi:hypothetical protein [Leptospira ryugenii]|uniref:hypothetical protein n=1 Tax=Leptospira ryugenii TaxID=1917863 RepID=UPI000D592E6B|nr:hypothetical protein [Leptospira ryugenii]
MKYISFIICILLLGACNQPSQNNESESITNLLLLQRISSSNSGSSSSGTATTPPNFTTLTLGTQVSGSARRNSPAYFKFTTTSAATYYYAGFGKSNSFEITLKLFNSTSKLDSSTQLQTKTSGFLTNSGEANSIALEANKEYAFEISTTSESNLTFQFIVLNNHLSGKASCQATLSTDCYDYPSGSTLNSCPTLTTNYSTSSCATRFPAKTIVGRCTWLFAEGADTVYSFTYYNDGTYTTTGAANTSCTGAGRARFFTNN